MKSPSRTATLTALMRALGNLGLTSAKEFTDPVAAKLLPPGRALAIYAVTSALMHVGARRVLRRGLAPGVDTQTLRTLAIDEALASALHKHDSNQLVILGAGLDGRAFRLSGLASIDVFEVDHPATQTYKRTKAMASGLVARSRSLVYVPVDFESDPFAERLALAGFNAKRQSAWVWEGVVMYLSDNALRMTLDSIVCLSTPQSRLIVQYKEPSDDAELLQQCSLTITRKLGEPQIGLRPRTVMRDEMERHGFRILSDDGAAEWATRFGARMQLPVALGSRLIVAERR